MILILKILQALDEILESQKPLISKLTEEMKTLQKHVSPDLERLKKECDDAQAKWNKVKMKVSKDLHLLEEITPKLRAFEVRPKSIRSLAALQVKQ